MFYNNKGFSKKIIVLIYGSIQQIKIANFEIPYIFRRKNFEIPYKFSQRISDRYLIYTKDLKVEDGGMCYIPMYMAMFV